MGIGKDKGKDKSRLTATAELRRQAEAQVPGNPREEPPPRSEAETQRLFHELQVHQIELEMQNAELRQAREQLELSRDKHAELYDFAPVGFFCLDPSGQIKEVNLQGAQLLGVVRQQLVNRPLSEFIVEADQQKIFANHLALVVQRRTVLKCLIKLTRPDGTAISGKFQSVAVNLGNETGMILSALSDDTTRRQLEIALQETHDQLEATVVRRTEELSRSNALLLQEIADHKRAEDALRGAYAEITRLKDQLQEENLLLREEVTREYQFSEVIGHSDAISYVFFRVEQVAPQDVTVLLLGETGTGKGLIARAIHSRSVRKEQPMVTVNCTALPANLIESELFGREKGAFTGAHVRQMGRFELADGGTIFLDEIGEMPLELQCKLLRVIQDGEFERLGSPRTIKVNARIIAASNRNLEEEIRAGRFRQDLFYRLNVFPITIPPLRQRKEDILPLVNYFIAKYNKKIGRKITSLSQATLESLQQYHWPGNVRELENVVERAIVTSRGPVLQVLDRFDTFPQTGEQAGQDVKVLADLEQEYISQALETTGWRIEGSKGAAVRLGLNPSTLRARMRKYGIRRQ